MVTTKNDDGMLRQFLFQLYWKMADLKLFISSLFVSIIFFIIFTVLELQIDSSGPGAITAFQLAFSDERAFELIGKWGARGVELFKISLIIDMFFPISYLMTLSSGVSYFSQLRVTDDEIPTSVLLPFTLPFIAVLLDWAENFLQFVMISDTSFINDVTTSLVGLYAILKFLLLGVTIFFLVYYIIQTIVKR